jgi:hypothetical protein
MARRLSTPDQPRFVRGVLRVYEFLASLQFAVVLITLLAVVLGLGTFVESGFGTEAVKFGVWNTWWFTLLNALLAVSIFSAAAIRYPWKRHQTGFVITHIGLLVLLAGCLLSQRGGIDAQIPLIEGDRGRLAYEDSHSFVLEVERDSRGGREVRSTRIGPLAFRAGPFNWNEYPGRTTTTQTGSASQASAEARPSTRRSWFPWSLSPRDEGVLVDQDGIRLEVLDYYADSTAVLAPSVSLRIGSDAFSAGGRAAESMWIPVDLSWQPNPLAGGAPRHRQTIGGGTVVFWKTRSQAETDAFLEAVPDPETGFGRQGQLVLVAEDQVHRVLVDDVLGQGRQPIEGTNISFELDDFEPRLSAVRGRVFLGEDLRGEEIVIVADMPEVAVQATRAGVYGSLWLEPEVADSSERMQGKAKSRIDIIQGSDRELYYRCWQPPAITAGRLPTDGTSVPAFTMPMARLEMRVERFLPADALEVVTLPLPFDKKKPPSAKRRAARVRLSVDGREEEFWLAGMPIEPSPEPPNATERKTVAGSGRTVAVTLEPDAVDIGFDVKLDNFERRLDPGTSQASHFSSIVEFLDDEGRPLVDRPVTITMNAPVDFSDPKTGHSYRLFQESFMGPWLPGDPLYERFAKATADGASAAESGPPELPERLEASVLTVNYDPGRGVKYTGSMLIVAGIFTMFYMKAYFFAPKRRPQAGRDAVEAPPARELVAI